jgi:hypothetical protein
LATIPDSPPQTRAALQPSEFALLASIAMAPLLIHVLTGSRYGFHRDELATLEDARNLAWGYVAYPPMTPAFGRLSLLLFGTSLVGFRFFAAVAQAIALLLAGLMAREFGGRRGAQLLTMAAGIPFCLAGGALMQYVSFDYLFWVLAAYSFVRLRASGNPRWWLAIGAAIGLGMMSKYTMGFFALGIVAAVLFTGARRDLRSKWLWFGVALSVALFLPNVFWQAQNHFISLEFLKHIHARDIRIGRTKYFLPEQLKLTLLAFPLALAGLLACLFSEKFRQYRGLPWMYLVPLVLFVAAKGRFYYLAGAYPMLYAAGSVWGEEWLATQRNVLRIVVRAAAWTALFGNTLFACAFLLPTAPVGSAWFQKSNAVQGDFREEIGWEELVKTIAQVRDSLPPEERMHVGILATNYGEAGAVNLYGERYGLPRAISGVNSFWREGYGDPPPQILIVVGLARGELDDHLTGCSVVGHTWNRYGVKNEETEDHPDIYVCRGLKEQWPEFWKHFRYFG